MSKIQTNFVRQGCEFLAANWLIVIALLVVVVGLAYLGFIRDTLDDQYRHKLRYYSCDQILNAEAIQASTDSVTRRKKQVKALLYLKNVNKLPMPPFQLELKKLARDEEVELSNNICEFPGIPPDSIVAAKHPIVFKVQSDYGAPYVSFLGKVRSVAKASLVGEWFSVTPDDPISIVVMIDSDELEYGYHVGLSACNLYQKRNSNEVDSLKIGLNLLNNTARADNNVSIKISSLMLRLYNKQTGLSSTTEIPINAVKDSIRCGLMPVGDFSRLAEQFKFSFVMPRSTLSASETLCAYFEVIVYENAAPRRRVVLAIEPAIIPSSGPHTESRRLMSMLYKTQRRQAPQGF